MYLNPCYETLFKPQYSIVLKKSSPFGFRLHFFEIGWKISKNIRSKKFLEFHTVQTSFFISGTKKLFWELQMADFE